MASQGLYCYLNVGVFQGKLADGRRHHAQAQRRRAGKAQNAAARPAHCIDARLDTFQPQEMALYGVEQFVRLGRGPKSTVQHVEQRDAAGRLNLTDEPADGWLRGMQHASSAGGCTGVPGRAEYTSEETTFELQS